MSVFSSWSTDFCTFFVMVVVVFLILFSLSLVMKRNVDDNKQNGYWHYNKDKARNAARMAAVAGFLNAIAML